MGGRSVLFFNRVYPPGRGATGRVLQELARSFAKKKWHVTIVTTGKKAGIEKDGPITVIRVKGPEKPSGSLSYGFIALKMLMAGLRQSGNVDLVVSMTDPPLFVIGADWLAKRKQARHIHWCQDLFPDILPALDMSLPKNLADYLTQKTYQAMSKAEKVIVIGRCMARHLTQRGFDPKDITVIPNWPNFELVRRKSKKSFAQLTGRSQNEGQDNGAKNGKAHGALEKTESGNAKTPLHQEPRPYQNTMMQEPLKFRVLYAGNLGLAHPYETILEAAELLKDDCPDIEFVFVGDGARYDYLAQERSKRELDNIRLMPYQPNALLKQVMESGDLHLISMKDEAAGFLVPSKLYSALAVRRPVIMIGPEQSEAAKVIHDFKAGDVVRHGQPQQLAARIKAYRENSDIWFAAHEGAAHAAKVFVPNEAIKAWIKRADAIIQEAKPTNNLPAGKATESQQPQEHKAA